MIPFHTQHAHGHAMDAKRAVFLAQDAISRAYSVAAEIRRVPEQRREMRRLDRLAKKLQRAREVLEAFDREYGARP